MTTAIAGRAQLRLALSCGHSQESAAGAAADQARAERDFRSDLNLILSEGHAVVVLDDVPALKRTYRLGNELENLLANGRDAGVSCIAASQTTGWVPGRTQMSAHLIGYLGSGEAAKAALPLISQRGRNWQDTLDATQRYHWIYHDKLLGDTGPCRTAVPAL